MTTKVKSRAQRIEDEINTYKGTMFFINIAIGLILAFCVYGGSNTVEMYLAQENVDVLVGMFLLICFFSLVLTVVGIFSQTIRETQRTHRRKIAEINSEYKEFFK